MHSLPFLLKIIWRNSCGVEVRDLKLNHAETDLFSGEQCQPALLLHWNGNRPAAPLILVDTVTVWQKNGTRTLHQVVYKILRHYCSRSHLHWLLRFPKHSDGSTLHSRRALHSLQSLHSLPFLLKIIWRNSCGVEVRDLKLNHAETDLFSGECQPALLLHWNGNRPAAPLILVDKVTVWQETGHAHFTKLYTKSWGIIVVEVICTDSCASQNTPMNLHCIHAVHCIHCSQCIHCHSY